MTVTWQGHRVTAGVRQAILRGLFIGANLVRNDAIQSIVSGQKTGRIYQRRNRVHRASAPGEPPAADSPFLHTTIALRPELRQLVIYVNASARYARALEYGTVKMEPRPFLRPALARNRRAIEGAIAAEVAAYIASGRK